MHVAESADGMRQAASVMRESAITAGERTQAVSTASDQACAEIDQMTDKGSSLDNFGTTSASSGGQDGNGNYIFAGYSTQTQPFAQTATGASYSGDQNYSGSSANLIVQLNRSVTVSRPVGGILSSSRRSLGGHPSERPTWGCSSLEERASSPFPTLGLAPGGVYRADQVALTAGALLPHRFTLTCADPEVRHRRFAFCGTFLRVAPTGC